ncbi:nitroreductase family protein [Aerococcus viridans]
MNLELKKALVKMVPDKFMGDFKSITKTRKMNKLINYDKNRFSKYAFVDQDLSYNQIEARLTKEYHSLEKGLTYSNLRLGFGKKVLNNVITLMEIYRDKGFPLNSHVYETSLSVLEEYIKVHKDNGYDVEELEEKFILLGDSASSNGEGGYYEKTKHEVFNSVSKDFKDFSQSRFSIREYTEEPVSYEKIEESLKLASHTPSACNRQPWKIRIVSDSKMKKILQNNQNGNRGFGDYIDKFIIITSDVEYYDKGRERNQANIDGGMYAMNLLYSLHYNKIATVPLSASLSIDQEKNLRNEFEIPDSENFILFIGIGNYTENFKITKSSRRDVSYIKF